MQKLFAPTTEVNDASFIEDIHYLRQENNKKATEGGSADAYSDYLGVLVSYFFNFLSTLANVTIGMVNYWVQFKMADFNNATVRNVEKKIDKMKERIEKDSYLSMSGVLVPCPDGFNGNFPQYVDTLMANSATVFDNAFRMADDLQVIVTEFTNSKSARLAVRDYSKMIDTARKVRESQEKMFLDNFSTGSNQRLRFDKMFEMKTDVVPTLNKTVDLYKYVNKYSVDAIKARAAELAKRIDVLIAIQKKASKEEMRDSKVAFLGISEYTLEVARQLEHVGKFMVRAEMAFVVTSNLSERMTSQA